MSLVKAKKHLGQHFLTDKNIAQKIVDGLIHTDKYRQVLEVGPGMGILSDILLQRENLETFRIDIDVESFHFLREKYPQLGDRLINGDFLKLSFESIFPGKFAVIGNFPYNISSQILFRILENRQNIVEMVGMFQKEVAERVAAKPSTKEYGILSVLTQAYYDIDYLFTVKPGTFNPPPKVNSGVIRLSRNGVEELGCDEKLFWRAVKAGFNQRRKTLRNALSAVVPRDKLGEHPFYEKRAEQLTVADFIELTNFYLPDDATLVENLTSLTVMKISICTLLISLLGLVAFAQQDQNQTDLDALYQAIQKMPSYKKLLKSDASYQRLYEEVKEKVKDADEKTTFKQLSRLIFPINDNHLGFYRTPDSTLKAAYVTLPINTDSLRKQLAQKDKNELEGIYYMGEYDFGLYTTDQQHYKLVLLKNGILMSEIIKTPYGGYDCVQYGGRNVPYQLIKNVRLINGQLIGTPFVKSKEKRFSTLAKSAENFEYKSLDDETGYLRLSNFNADNTNIKKSEEFFKTIDGRLAAKYLIVDLRNNSGGGYKTSQKFINLLKKYKGKIFILQNAQTVSNAEQVIIALKDQKNVTTLGEQSKGMITFGSNYGKTILLPSGRFTFYPTDMTGVDKDLAHESKGVDPDVLLDPYKGDWIEQTLEYIKKKP